MLIFKIFFISKYFFSTICSFYSDHKKLSLIAVLKHEATVEHKVEKENKISPW